MATLTSIHKADMPVSEVTNLRKNGQLKEAFELAKSYLQSEDSEWARGAMFWVLRDLFREKFNEGNLNSCRTLFSEMQSMLSHMDDSDGYGKKALASAKKMLSPNAKLIEKANGYSKNGQEKIAYENVIAINTQAPIEDSLHEEFGWIIYRYLKRYYEQLGSFESRKILFQYMQLHNPRPSLLHSQMLNLSSRVSEKYPGFKLLPFLRIWDVRNFMNDDLREGYYDGRTIQPLFIRIFERCLSLGYSLDECMEVFSQNPHIPQQKLVAAFSQYEYFAILNLSKNDSNKAIAKIVDYMSELNCVSCSNEFNSRIIRTFVFLNRENLVPNAKEILEGFGFDKFQPQDWTRDVNEKDSNKPYPSLVERFIKIYNDSLSVANIQIPNESYQDLLKTAIEKYPDNNELPRYLAKTYISFGKNDLAINLYKGMLLKNNKFYLWKEFANLADSQELKISSLCKAILSEPNDDFLGEVHLLLANELINKGDFAEAKCELKTYKDTYMKNSWPLNASYETMLLKIPQTAEATKSNLLFYRKHEDVADEFIYNEIPWIEMVVIDIYKKQKQNGKMQTKAKLVAADGTSVSVNLDSFTNNSKPHLYSCYDVKLVMDDDKVNLGIIRASNRKVDDVFTSRIGYVTYYDIKQKRGHIYDTGNEHFVFSTESSEFREGVFVRFFSIPESKNKKKMIETQTTHVPRAIFIEKVNARDAVTFFAEHVGVVDDINKSKQLFHCAFGRGVDTIVFYSETSIRPNAGDVVVSHYVKRRDKNNRLRLHVLDIEIDNERRTPLIRTIEGSVRTNYNSKGDLFGFVEDYYVPGYLILGVEDGETIKIKVAFDGSRWRSISRVYDL